MRWSERHGSECLRLVENERTLCVEGVEVGVVYFSLSASGGGSGQTMPNTS